MRKYPFDYNIHPDNSPEMFKAACEKIESSISGLQKRDLLVDVDGTTIQVYDKDGNEIIVFDDYTIGAVFTQSDIVLDEIFI